MIMTELKAQISTRANDLIALTVKPEFYRSVDTVLSGTESLLILVHGEDDPRTKSFLESAKQIRGILIAPQALAAAGGRARDLAVGYLRTLLADIDSGFLVTLERRFVGEITGDFLSLAKLTFSDKQTGVAAVLASAAIEDAFKRLALANGLDVRDKDMPEVIGALSGKGLLSGAQLPVAKSYVQLRNKAMHAQFDKIDAAEVGSLIAFTEQFLLGNF